MRLEPEESPATVEVPSIEVDNVTTILGGAVVLHRLRLEVPAGQVTVLMGPSGAGKSTLIKHVVGLLEPGGGTVRIGGQDIWSLPPEQLREVHQGIGAMLGGSSLFNTSTFGSLSVLNNLVATLGTLGVPREQRHDRAVARLRELKLLELHDRLPEQLPAHAMKRLALARALVADAPVTVLDEIDVGLDHEHSTAMLEAVRELRRRTGCTLLVTTHSLELAAALADQLAILVNGRIVACGHPAELLEGIYSTEDFDRRFEFSDYLGAPRLRDAQADADRQRPIPNKHIKISFQARLVWTAVIAFIAVAALLTGVQYFSSY